MSGELRFKVRGKKRVGSISVYLCINVKRKKKKRNEIIETISIEYRQSYAPVIFGLLRDALESAYSYVYSVSKSNTPFY